MKIIPRLIILFSILAAGTLLDQMTKAIAKEKLSSGETYSYFFDSLKIQYSENTGAFLSIGENLPDTAGFIFLTILPAVFLVLLFIYLVFSKNISAVNVTAFSLILTGGINNIIIGRLFNGRRVIDFMSFGFGPYFRFTGILNFADMYVTAGFIIIVLLVLTDRKKDTLLKKD